MLKEKDQTANIVDDAADSGALEIEGASQNEAMQRACEALNTRLENLGFEILKESRGGLMGLMRGGKKVRIRAWRKDMRGQASLSEAAQLAKASLKEILKHICEITNLDVLEQDDCVTLLVEGDEGGLIIGKNGQTLDAMQYLLRRIVSKRFETFDKQIIVNTEGYRERKQENLISMAKRLAKQVRTSQRKEVLQPMNAYDRRIVHMALQEENGVVTRSQGEGMHRSIVIYPEDDKSTARPRRSSPTTASSSNDTPVD